MLTFYKKHAKDTFSQNGEDGIVEEVISRLKIESGLVVEFGCHDGRFCSNSRTLILSGWKGILIEADSDLFNKALQLYGDGLHSVQVARAFVTSKNVNVIIPDKIDVLSIDVDGIDAAIWDAYQGDAKIVIIEINSSLDPLSDTYADPTLGTSYKMMWRLGLSKGYFLLCHCGNMIFVQMGYLYLFPEFIKQMDKTESGYSSEYYHPMKDIELFFNKTWRP